MKHLYPFFILLTSLFGCQNQTQTLTAPFTAEIISLTSLDAIQMASSTPTYVLEPKTFSYLTNIEKLSGPYFKIHRGGSVFIENNEIKFGKSSNLKLKYRIQNNIIIPQDFTTLAMFSAFYQFDYIAQNLYQLTNISMKDITNEFGPYEIFFEASIQESHKGVLVKTYEKENAAYIPGTSKFLLFLRDNKEHVPLSLNLQVLAHEFGHAFWEYLLKDRNSKSMCDRLDSEYAIIGLNEGFSDFLSYSFTGSTNILYNSIPSERLARIRNFAKTNFTYSQIADIANDYNSICDQSYYCIGTLFANALFKAQKKLHYNQTDISGQNSRAEFLKKIIPALQKTRENFVYLPQPPAGYDPCLPGVNNTSTAYDGFILGLFFNAFLSQIKDKPVQSQLCQALVENFEEYGFPSELRKDYCL